MRRWCRRSRPVGQYPAACKVDVFEITLQPYEYVEYKYRLEHGATMLYAWEASAGVIHGRSRRTRSQRRRQPKVADYSLGT